jgi:hypothetical protein
VIPEVSRTETSNEVFNLQKCIAKAEMPALKKGLSGLERYEVKVSRTVLRGGSDGNVTLLPGGLFRPFGALSLDAQDNASESHDDFALG